MTLPLTRSAPAAGQRSIVCGGGAYVRDGDGAWRYSWGEPVPDACDLTVAQAVAVGADPVGVADQLRLALPDEVREVLAVLRRGAVRGGDRSTVEALRRRVGMLVCGLQAPELLAHALLDASQLAERLGVERETIDSYRTRGRLPEPTMVRGRTPLWSGPVIRRWQEQRRFGRG